MNKSKTDSTNCHCVLSIRTIAEEVVTCEKTFAGVSSGQRLDAVRGVGNLISSIFNGDGVGPGRIRDVGHSVRPIPVVLDGCVFWLALWILSIQVNFTQLLQVTACEKGAVPTKICTVSSPSPASRASIVNSTGRLAGTPLMSRPGPLARTLLASWPG